MIYKLSDQAIGAMMGVLQKALLEQTDIVPLLRDFDVQVDDSNHLVITNPVGFKKITEDTEEPKERFEQCLVTSTDAKNVLKKTRSFME